LGGAIAAATCCASQLLAITLGTAGLTAWLAKAAYVLVPVLLISAALIGVRVFRRRPTAPHAQTRGPRTDEKIMNDCCAQKDKGDDLAVIAAAPAMTPPRESNHGIARLRRL
jgi:hypothetical protein